MVARMKAGSVLVDVARDQGGCSETSRPTSHTDLSYVVDGVPHYCVINMPAAVARTSTFALNNATLGHAIAQRAGCARAPGYRPCARTGQGARRSAVSSGLPLRGHQIRIADPAGHARRLPKTPASS